MGDTPTNIELIQHRDPRTPCDWRVRTHHGLRGIDRESPRIDEDSFAWLCEADVFTELESRVAATDRGSFWKWMPAEARGEIYQMARGT